MEQRGERSRALLVFDDAAEAFDALPRSARRLLRLYAAHAGADGVARLTQLEAAERLGIGRFSVQTGLTALTKQAFVVAKAAGQIWVDERKAASLFRRRPVEGRSPELEAELRAGAERLQKKQAACRAAHHRKLCGKQVVIDPADVPDWPRPDA
jgi:hypothetical protein